MPHSRHRSYPEGTTPVMSSPPATAARASPGAGTGAGASRIGRPPQWTVSRSRKLARLYVYTTLSIEKIIKVLEDDVFKPRKNSAQKTVHKMLDNDPRYLRPDSRVEMNQRIGSLSASPARIRGQQERSMPYYHQQHPFRVPGYIEEDIDPLSPSSCAPVPRPGPGRRVQSFGLDVPSSISHYGITEGLRKLSTSEEPIPVAPQSSDDSPFGVHEIQRRVSNCSTIYATQISTLLRRFSISSGSDSLGEHDGSEPRHSFGSLAELRGVPGDAHIANFDQPFLRPGYALPGDYLRAYRWHCTDVSNPDHSACRCWCFVTQEMTAVPDAWFLPNGHLTDRAKVVLTDPSQAHVFPSDHYGNTVLHLFASLPGYREVLFGLLVQGVNPRLTNRGGQTFLHILHEEWFLDLSSPSALLRQLLAFLQDATPDLLFERDLYGRTFFHHAFSLVADHGSLAGPLSSVNVHNTIRRDAFGFIPQITGHRGEPGHPYGGTASPLGGRAGSPREHTTESRPSSADEVSFLAHHARLVQIIQSSYNDAQVEDAEGRNGLHCLAEAIINQQTMDEQRSVMTAGRSSKRKESFNTAKPTLASSGPGLSTTPSATSSRSNAEGTLLARLRHLEGLTIHSTHPVDVNHYDKHGNTVLMAFITHISDDQDDKSKTLVSILEMLIHAGARIEDRNRLGETALLVAARLGRKAALTTLLENGANVYARDAKGRGVLEVVDETCRCAKGDVALYARLEACRVLLTGRRDWGVVFRPSIVMEWGIRGGRH
ncbi:hypothetical protein V8F20_002817 [Naviculisporaceae sp. PSN 640]